jgi:hypothetical protein
MLTTLQNDIEDNATWSALHDYLIENELIPSWEKYSHVKDTRLVDAMLGCKAIASRQGKNRIENIHIYSEYCEPGYSHNEMGIAVGNWNGISSFQPATQQHETIDDSPELLGNLLEKLGVKIEWSDEWYSCCQCGGLVRTEPDSYWWQPFYEYYEGEVTCNRCLASQRTESED